MNERPARRSPPPVADVDLRLLRVFRAVVESGGFSAAEVALDVARSTISTHIATLETRLGLRLCERGRGGFSLTEAGTLVYAEAVRLLGAAEDFRSRVGAAHGRLAGELRIGLVDNLLTLPEIGLPRLIGRFGTVAPAVRVSLEVMATDDIEQGLASGRLHLGVLVPRRERTELVGRTVATERQHLYCGREHPLFGVADTALDDARIGACDFVGRSHVDETRASDRPWRKPPAVTANNLEAILMFVLSGRYLGMLPAQYAAGHVERGEVRALCADRVAIDKHFELLWRRSRSPSPVLSAFLDVHQALIEAPS